ncbi:heavy metal-associated isoprenylated plant protein 46-like [Salvia miltiorrhiza]|uniref:heavy metal-associated isoprenylated plant protein 46-like n=1 Tax=Salvia miltiorrhiza TaxID=226208 RepID=UPI0025AC730A|nr:heavy metal-associated isoprenylated plant protein 46-like [Salvia miltiorrhiza]
MKIKIVVRVSMNDEKSRSKALKISVGISGVESAALAGASKDQVVVAGESIDAVELTRQLRKGVGYAELVSVGEDKKEEKPAAKMEAPPPALSVPLWSYPYHPGYDSYPIYETRPSDTCTIM